MLRKIMIAVDCDSEEQARAVQNVMAELCANVKIDAVTLLAIYPAIKKNRVLIKNTINAIKSGGKMAVLKAVPALMKAFM